VVLPGASAKVTVDQFVGKSAQPIFGGRGSTWRAAGQVALTAGQRSGSSSPDASVDRELRQA
jgi:hypothetical protein